MKLGASHRLEPRPREGDHSVVIGKLLQELLGELQELVVLHFTLHLLLRVAKQEDLLLAGAVILALGVDHDFMRKRIDFVEWVLRPRRIDELPERAHVLGASRLLVDVALVLRQVLLLKVTGNHRNGVILVRIFLLLPVLLGVPLA